MKFQYFKVPNKDPKKKFISVPWIPASVRANDAAEFLGINMYAGEHIKTGGIGEEADIYYFDDIYINVGGEEIKTRCGFKDGYLANGWITGILGRQGFFDHFKVCIDEKSKEIELKSNS